MPFLICGFWLVGMTTTPKGAEAQTTESNSIVGSIDNIKRQSDRRLIVTGWSLDIHGNGEPVWIISIYNQQIVFAGSTSGGRADIAKVYPQSIADNVVISGNGPPIDCQTGQKVVTLAISMPISSQGAAILRDVHNAGSLLKIGQVADRPGKKRYLASPCDC